VARTRQGEERDQLEDQLQDLEAQWGSTALTNYVFPVVGFPISGSETEPAAFLHEFFDND